MGACCATSHDDRSRCIPNQTNQTKNKYPVDGNRPSQANVNDQMQQNCNNISLGSSVNMNDFGDNLVRSTLNPSNVRNEVSY